MPRRTLGSMISSRLRPMPWGLAALVGLFALPATAIGQAAATPQSHTVRTGDTLWGLAQQYLGDPLLWPELYRLNTAVVEDPHWIYPGEVLRISGSAAVASVPTTDTPVPVPDTMSQAAAPEPVPVAAEPSNRTADSSSAPSENFEPSEPLFPLEGSNRSSSMTLVVADGPNYHALRRGEFFSSAFLTEGRDLAFGKLMGPVLPMQIGAGAIPRAAALYDEVAVMAPQGASYQIGDSLLVARVGARVPGFGEVVQPTGLLRIVRPAEGGYVASVVAVYGSIVAGQPVMPAGAFHGSANVRPSPVANGVEGHLLGGPEPQILNGPQDVVFLDKGSKDGVAPGDLFDVQLDTKLENGRKMSVTVGAARLQIVRVGERSATARILGVSVPHLRVGMRARLVAKLPS